MTCECQTEVSPPFRVDQVEKTEKDRIDLEAPVAGALKDSHGHSAKSAEIFISGLKKPRLHHQAQVTCPSMPYSSPLLRHQPA